MSTKTTADLLEPVGAALVGANHALDLQTTASTSERAQMEVRDSPRAAVAAVEQSASDVEQLLVGALGEIGSAIGAFRTSLRPKD